MSQKWWITESVRPSGLTATTFDWVQYLKSFRGGDTEPERGLEYGRVVAKYVIHSNTQEEIRRHREPYPETLFNLSRFVTYLRTNTGDGKKSSPWALNFVLFLTKYGQFLVRNHMLEQFILDVFVSFAK